MKNISSIIKLLKTEYPVVMCTLDFFTPLQLLISTQLAAQCTDERVNQVTPGLFNKYKTVYDFAYADIEELESYIRPTGFYHNKAKNITNAQPIKFSHIKLKCGFKPACSNLKIAK